MVAINWNWWRHPPTFGLRARSNQSSQGLFVEDDEPRIRVIKDDLQRPIRFEAIGLSHHELLRLRHAPVSEIVYSSVFAVFTINAAPNATTSTVSGTYSIKDSRLTFVPHQPLLPDVTYRAVLHICDNDDPGTRSMSDINIQHEVEVPRPH
ncbi:MAG: hypothetical protein JWP89_5402 [Schlesneria sp.]|nr:hypothetical protein [Schlesneria sp.]